MDHFYENKNSQGSSSLLTRGRGESNPSRYDAHDAPLHSQGAAGDSESELLNYWETIRRHKTIIALFAFAFAVVGFLVGLPQKPVYRASTSIEVLNLNDDFMKMREISPTASNDASSDTSELQTQAALLGSASLLQGVSAQLDDRVPPPKAARKPSGRGFSIKHLLHLEPETRSRREILIAKAAESLQIRALPRTRILQATVDSIDPEFATDYLTALTTLFMERSVEARRLATEKTDDILKREIDGMRQKLERSEEALQAYAGSSGLIFADAEDDTTLSTEKLQIVQTHLAVATSDRIQKQSRYERAKSSPPDSLPDVLQDTHLETELEKINEQRAELARLQSTFTPKYALAKQAAARLAELENNFEANRNSIVSKVEHDYLEAVRREDLLRSEVAAQTHLVTSQGEKAVKYNVLKREVESNRDLYNDMLKELKESSVASAVGASKIHVVDPPETFQKPVRPNFKLYSGIGGFAGLFIGVVFVLLRDQTDRTLRDPGEAHFWTNVPELGTIPNALKLRKEAAGETEPVLPSLVAGRPGNILLPLARGGYLADSVRNVVTSILFTNDESHSRPRVLVVTSPEPGEGKTTVTGHIGIALSEIQGNVLVIEADLRRPRLAAMFNVANERGLSDYLRSGTLQAEAVGGLIQQTAVPGLQILPSGPAVSNAASLFYTPQFARLLQTLRQQYSMVIIDTPPMLDMTDARVIGRLADGVVLVARAGQTTRDSLMAANQRLREDRIRVLGTVFNDWSPKNGSSRLYSRKRKQYRSYPDDPDSDSQVHVAHAG